MTEAADIIALRSIEEWRKTFNVLVDGYRERFETKLSNEQIEDHLMQDFLEAGLFKLSGNTIVFPMIKVEEHQNIRISTACGFFPLKEFKNSY